MRRAIRAALHVIVATSLGAGGAARAEPDTFLAGDGHNGPLTVSAAGTIINAYAEITGAVARGATAIDVASAAGFGAGDLILVWQTAGLATPPVSGNGAQIDLTGSMTGTWELARVLSAGGTRITVTRPLERAYAASGAQVVRVPEHTTVTITAAGTLAARPWDGRTGGIVALLASGRVDDNGRITADGAGFRRGTFADGPRAMGCTGLDEPGPNGAQKGEGLGGGFGRTGRGNLANGAGGGVCEDSGGGGGGGAGAGGDGGRTAAEDGSRDVAGNGGSQVVFTAVQHLVLGGGGGAGHGDDSGGSSGGAGGGVVFVRAGELAGTGMISANGGAGGPGPTITTDGQGGGGGGGTVYARFAGAATCTGVLALGGTGESARTATTTRGPGGGGGGGKVLFQSSMRAAACALNVTGGAPGVTNGLVMPFGIHHGGEFGQPGVIEPLAGGFSAPPAPMVIAPTNGSTTTDPTPAIRGRSEPNSTVVLFIDGVEIGRAPTDAGGTFDFEPPNPVALGAHTLVAVAEVDGIRSAPTTVRFAYALVVDSDNDGLFDPTEMRLGTNPNDPDSDGDGINDSIETNGGQRVDTDGDLTVDALDLDSDMDGRPDMVEGIGDDDVDGIPNWRDPNDRDGPGGDLDNDGLINGLEVRLGTNPMNPDTDGDGIRDGREVELGTNPRNRDTDGDGISDGVETDGGMPTDTDMDMVIDALDGDSDGDRAPDSVEGTGDSNRNGVPNWRDPTDQVDPQGDFDLDGLRNVDEIAAGTDPTDRDTDGDGIPDGAEVSRGGRPNAFDTGVDTDPLDADTDDDGIADGEEIIPGNDGFVTNPLSRDTDGDGLADGLETGTSSVSGGRSNGGVSFRGTGPSFVMDADPSTTTDPTRADTDRGTVSEGVEDTNRNGRVDMGERDPNDPADDVPRACGNGRVDNGERCDDGDRENGDGCSASCTVENGWVCRGTMPSVCTGPAGDPDNDGLTNEEERRLGTDPLDADTDNDGIADPVEVARGGDPRVFNRGIDTDPLDADSDDDGISDGEETIPGNDGIETNPLRADTDNDGLLDGVEVSSPPVAAGRSEGEGIPYGGTSGAYGGDADPSTKTDPRDADTDDGSVPDGTEDTDHNGRVDMGERDPNAGADDVPPGCGDGMIVPPEVCDDNNTAEGDGCNAACAVEPGWTCTGVPSTCMRTPTSDGDDDDDGFPDNLIVSGGQTSCATAGSQGDLPAVLVVLGLGLLVRRRRR